jgi:hypothetical protein
MGKVWGAGGSSGAFGAAGGSVQGPGPLKSLVPSLLKLRILCVEDRPFGHQDIAPGSIVDNPVLKERPEASFRTVARDGFAHLFSCDKGDTGLGAFLIKEDKPGGVPDFVGTTIDPVEVTLLRDPSESA